MLDSSRRNGIVAIGIAAGCAVLVPFLTALLGSKSGEVAGAFGSVLGGIVGAGGAVLTVFLLIDRQRREEAQRVTHAIVWEVKEISTNILFALK